MNPQSPDDRVLDLANRENAVLVTADKDFGELVFRQGRINSGVVLLRLAGLTLETKASIVGSAIASHAIALPRAFTVIAPGAVRIRRSPQRSK
jgi:predicted nuclease of predicted toxin-antitoxin system